MISEGESALLETADDEETELSEAEEKLYSKIENAFKTKLCLSSFATTIAVHFLRSRLCREGGQENLSRVVGYTLDVVNDKSNRNKIITGSSVDWQKGCPNIIRGLRASPFWDTGEFPWIKNLEAACSGICSELLDLKGHHSFQPYRSPISSTSSSASTDSLGNLATSSGDWNVCYLQLHGVDVGNNLEKCPITAAALSHILRQYRHSFFSVFMKCLI
jgi:hypothetical protein